MNRTQRPKDGIESATQTGEFRLKCDKFRFNTSIQPYASQLNVVLQLHLSARDSTHKMSTAPALISWDVLDALARERDHRYSNPAQRHV